MASLDIFDPNRLNLKNKITKIENKIFCGQSKILKNISWSINVCLKYFMTSTNTLRCPPSPLSSIFNARSLLQKSPFNAIEKKQRNKQPNYERVFKNNLNNLKNICKGIRILRAVKHSSAWNIQMIPRKVATVTGLMHIADILNDYFSSIAEKTKTNIKSSNKSFQDLLHHSNKEYPY